MPTIYRRNSERISVADAKQLILDSLPLEHGGGQIFGKPGPDGEVVWDFDTFAKVSAAEAHAPYLDSNFLELCRGLGFEPHMMFSPAIGGYSGKPEQDNAYMLTHAQFVKVAETYSLTVEIETASSAPTRSAGEPAPVVTASASVTHSTKARRDTLTPVVELAQKRCRNPKDTAEVWAVLLVLAEQKHPPLLGATEDGLQYLKGGAAANFNRGALRKRLGR